MPETTPQTLRGICLLGALALAACSGGARGEREGAEAVPVDWDARRAALLARPLSGFVLVPGAARLAAKPEELSQDAEPLGQMAIDATGLADMSLLAAPFEVVEDRGGAVLVRSLTPEQLEAHCQQAPRSKSWRAVALEVWVRRVDLLPVVVRAVAKEHQDGSGYVVNPGMPLLRATQPRHDGRVAQVGGVRLTVELAPEDEALSFAQVSERFAYPEDENTEPLVLRRDAILRVDGRPILRAGELSKSWRVVHQSVEVEEELLVRMGDGCAQIVARAERAERALIPSSGDITSQSRRSNMKILGAIGARGSDDMVGEVFGGVGSGESAVARFTDLGMPEEAPLWWPDGTRAGTLLDPRPWGMLERTTRGTLHCVSPPLGLETMLCVRADREAKESP